MARLLVIYKTPADPAAFDRHYSGTHIPLVKKMPGLRSYRVSRGAVGGAPGIHLVAELGFDNMATLEAARGSPEGAAAAGDLKNFAAGGADVYVYDDVPA